MSNRSKRTTPTKAERTAEQIGRDAEKRDQSVAEAREGAHDGYLTLLDRPKRRTSLRLAFDPADADRIAAARIDLARAEATASTSRGEKAAAANIAVADAARDVEALLDEIPTVTWRFASIGPDVVEDLQALHPVKKADAAEAKSAGQSLTFDPVSFPRALISATLASVTLPDDTAIDEMTESQVGALFDSGRWPVEDQTALFTAALSVDQRGSMIAEMGND